MAKTEEEKLLEKRRKIAAKLSPRPVELPSHKWRCQIMVEGERLSAVDEDPEVAHATVLALKAGLLEKREKTRPERITLNDAITKYIDDRRGVLSPSTIRSYKETQKNRIQELLKKKVADIAEADLQIAISSEAKAGRSAKTIKNDISLAVAVLSQYKAINTKRLKYPQRIRKEHAYLDTDQIVKLISGCEGDKAEIPILLALWLGLRRSEILGLYWDCVDFESGLIHIRRSLVRDEDGIFAVKDYLKNESSRRSVSCPGYILEKLRAYPGEHEGRVFKTNDTSFIYDRLQIICKREGITFPGVHGLRHTNASVMLSLGIIDKYAMARGGWSMDHTMKTVYQHLFSKDKAGADQAINTFFEQFLHTDLHTNDIGP